MVSDMIEERKRRNLFYLLKAIISFLMIYIGIILFFNYKISSFLLGVLCIVVGFFINRIDLRDKKEKKQ